MIKNLQLKETIWSYFTSYLQVLSLLTSLPQKLLQNINEIKDLIINKKFIPFPPQPKPTYEDTVHYIQLM
jgi:hypothetical protein